MTSQFVIPNTDIPIQEETPEEALHNHDTAESIHDYERFQGLFPWDGFPTTFEVWADSHLEVALETYQKFLSIRFEYLGHTFKPVYSEEANDNCFPYPLYGKDELDWSAVPLPIEGWDYREFLEIADEAGCSDIHIYLMDDHIYILNSETSPLKIVV